MKEKNLKNGERKNNTIMIRMNRTTQNTKGLKNDIEVIGNFMKR